MCSSDLRGGLEEKHENMENAKPLSNECTRGGLWRFLPCAFEITSIDLNWSKISLILGSKPWKTLSHKEKLVSHKWTLISAS